MYGAIRNYVTVFHDLDNHTVSTLKLFCDRISEVHGYLKAQNLAPPLLD